MKRKIVNIDEAKCNGCGECVPSCAEGAIQIIDGKAKLVSDVYCDGLGACLGTCPMDAITIEEREAEAFDEAEALAHVAKTAQSAPPSPSACPSGGCPGSLTRSLQPAPAESSAASSNAAPSQLMNWPVQLTLISPASPFLKEADLLLAADCAPCAMPDFHSRFLCGRPLLVACPKLDDASAHIDKLAAILKTASAKSVTILRMEVPCCAGLTQIAREAASRAGTRTRLVEAIVGIDGKIRNEKDLC